jgi:serine/threonine protein kinase
LKGKVLNGRYQIIDLIDAGGMGLVYKGQDKKTGNTVAVKILKPEYAKQEEYVSRFKKEASAASSLKHKNIVRVADSGNDGDVHYIIQEYVEGKTLKSVILENGAMDYQKAIRIMIDICSAMEYAHMKGLVHRDIKPQNILIDKSGIVKVTDFGIAKDVSSTTLTSLDSGIMGSVHYFSPEQAKGEKVDNRSDIYSLGIVFYEMVTGALPFTGDTSIAIAIKHLSDTVKPPREINAAIPKSVNNIIVKATRKDKELRYPSAGEFKDDLLKAIIKPDGNFVKLKDPESKRIKKERNRSKRNIFFLAMMTLLVVAILGTIFLMASNFFFSDEKNKVSVPKFIGLTEVDALNESAKIGLKIEKQYEYSNKVAEGAVISQSPKEGTAISKDASVTIKISLGNKQFEVPKLIDETLETAAQILKDNGLVMGIISYEPSDKPAGYIISQSPEAGGVTEKGAAVNVVVSHPEEVTNVVIPKLTGEKLENAAELLKNAKISRVTVYEDEKSDKAETTVLSQQPEDGIAQTTNDPLSVWISAYKEKKYSAQIDVNATITEADTLVRVVLEHDFKGVTAMFTEESTQNPGDILISENIKSHFKGKHTVVVLVGSEEIFRKELLFQ